MQRSLQRWAANGKDYWQGVYLYSNLADHDPALLKAFKTRRTDEREKQLIFLLSSLIDQSYTEEPKAEPTPAAELKAPDVYAACKSAADAAYKEVMNARAVLFNLSQKNRPTDEEKEQRRVLALQVIKGWKELTELYDKAAYVKEHGRLPTTNEKSSKNNNEAVPDFMVYCQLDNLRKNISKLKKRPPTPERLQLIVLALVAVIEGR